LRCVAHKGRELKGREHILRCVAHKGRELKGRELKGRVRNIEGALRGCLEYQ